MASPPDQEPLCSRKPCRHRVLSEALPDVPPALLNKTRPERLPLGAPGSHAPANTPSLPRLRQRPVPTHVEGAAPGLRPGCGCSTEMCLSSHGTGGGCPGDHLGLRLLNTSQHNYDEGGAHKRLARKERDHCPPGTSGLGRPSRGPPGAMPSRGDLRGSHRGWRPPKPASGQGPRPQPQASCTDSHKRKPYPPPCGGLRRWSGLEATRGPLRMGSEP